VNLYDLVASQLTTIGTDPGLNGPWLWDLSLRFLSSVATDQNTPVIATLTQAQRVGLAVATIDHAKTWLRVATDALLSSPSMVPVWSRRIGPMIGVTHAAASLAIAGGVRPPAVIVSSVSESLKEQSAYLIRWQRQLVEGLATYGPAAAARVTLYGSAAWATSQNAARKLRIASGFTEERRVMGRIQHCPECPPLAALGWSPIGSLPLIGSTVCRVNCDCTFHFR
jgi:hypothetical protein